MHHSYGVAHSLGRAALYHHHSYGYGGHGGGLLSGFASIVVHAIVYGVVSHLIGALFRGHSLVVDILIGGALFIGAFLIFRFFQRGSYA
jgi:hypothetical protein